MDFFLHVNFGIGRPITSFIDEITPHICNVCFITFLVCSEAYFVLDKFEEKKKLGLELEKTT